LTASGGFGGRSSGRGRRLRVAVYGLGEAGSCIASDLATAGATVLGYDPAPVVPPAGVSVHERPTAAVVVGVDLIMAITAAADAPEALAQGLMAIRPGTLYADLSTGPAALKRELAATAEDAGLRFVDVALMAPVPGRGLRTPALASGEGAQAFVELVAPLGMPVTHAGDEPGAAATRKLLRSVVVKGLAAVLVEALQAAAAAGLAAETWSTVVDQLTSADEDLLRRLLAGTAAHAERRAHEMDAAADLLADLGVDPVMTAAVASQLHAAAADPASVPRPPR
jgi:3-hydroxyisobutyrate dehydrogenase-like beta-hydroxyacid dehydrogenase